jgi:hypothetical protein
MELDHQLLSFVEELKQILEEADANQGFQICLAEILRNNNQVNVIITYGKPDHPVVKLAYDLTKGFSKLQEKVENGYISN